MNYTIKIICLIIAKFDDISAVTLQGNSEMSETRA